MSSIRKRNHFESCLGQIKDDILNRLLIPQYSVFFAFIRTYRQQMTRKDDKLQKLIQILAWNRQKQKLVNRTFFYIRYTHRGWGFRSSETTVQNLFGLFSYIQIPCKVQKCYCGIWSFPFYFFLFPPLLFSINFPSLIYFEQTN